MRLVIEVRACFMCCVVCANRFVLCLFAVCYGRCVCRFVFVFVCCCVLVVCVRGLWRRFVVEVCCRVVVVVFLFVGCVFVCVGGL